MAFTFLASLGHGVGRSLVEPDRIDVARTVLQQARAAAFPYACQWTWSSPTRSTTRAVSARSPSGRSRPIGWGSISGPPLWRSSARPFVAPRPLSGTGRWGSSRTRPSRQGRSGWPRPSASERVFGRRWRGHHRGDPPGGGHVAHRIYLDGRWRVPRVPRGPRASWRRRAQRRLTDAHAARVGNWKMHCGARRGPELAQSRAGWAQAPARRRGRGVPALHGAAAVADALAGSAIGLGAQNCHWEDPAARSPARCRLPCWQSSGAGSSSLGTRSAATSFTRRTTRSTARSRPPCAMASSRSCVWARPPKNAARG